MNAIMSKITFYRLTELQNDITDLLNVKRTKATIKLNQKFKKTNFRVSDKVLVRKSGINPDKTWYPLNSCLVIKEVSQDGRTVTLMNESGEIVHTTTISNIRSSTKTSKVLGTLLYNLTIIL